MENGTRQSIVELLKEIGPGRNSNSAYDTAWVARLGEIDKPMSDAALDWISENQLPDGSWGTNEPRYYHDRLICTLSAMIALARRGKRASDHRQIQRGLDALENLTNGATKGLMADPGGATIGFEMIVPTLLAEAESLGIIQNQGERILGRISRQRETKLNLLKGHAINRYVSAAFSAEMAGADGARLLDIENLQEPNGCVAYSPAATSYFALTVRPDPGALQFLRSVSKDGGVPYIAPIDVFEIAWTIWNLLHTNRMDAELTALCQPHLDYMETLWKTGKGIPAVGGLTLIEGDTTSVAYTVLERLGRAVDFSGLLYYENGDHFRCFDYEANSSISTNVHVLGALRHMGLERSHPVVAKVLAFLAKVRTSDTYWFDKWHASPYYTTSHAIIGCAGYEDGLVEKAVEWICQTQLPNGSWGYYNTPTAEETAYCLHALAVWRDLGKPVPPEAIKRGAGWLAEHTEAPYPCLWIGKSLYCPELVVRSAILTALYAAG